MGGNERIHTFAKAVWDIHLEIHALPTLEKSFSNIAARSANEAAAAPMLYSVQSTNSIRGHFRLPAVKRLILVFFHAVHGLDSSIKSWRVSWRAAGRHLQRRVQWLPWASQKPRSLPHLAPRSLRLSFSFAVSLERHRFPYRSG